MFPQTSQRALAKERVRNLLKITPELATSHTALQSNSDIHNKVLTRLICYSGYHFRTEFIILASIFCAAGIGYIAYTFLSLYFIPLYAAAGAWIPFLWLESKITKRAANFAADYPSILLATASGLKVGHPPVISLERAARLLPNDSLAKIEIEKLLSSLRRGAPKEEAVKNFASSIFLPDLELFRSAFLLVLENGGKFAPTLERLAQVSSDRTVLITSARVTTANMRMTANFLIAITPFLLLVTSSRSERFWEQLFTHPTANVLGSVGFFLITAGYATLQKMSRFKP